MEYEFTFDQYEQPLARFDMGSEAFSPWFTDECNTPLKAKQLLEVITQLEQKQRQAFTLIGTEYKLSINQQGAEVSALNLEDEFSDELPEGTNPYDAELQAGCGLEDFKEALTSWLAFLTNH
ncbi:YacL family protein [Neptunomonas concharum]|uniref:UPF0231 family protein n=1 Tax=Neptunomonas concharum TaxID=1031538 RepID=UPI001476D863|nr:YacL family protein [Neptunomonas concharum]